MRARISSGEVATSRPSTRHRALVGHQEAEQRLEQRALAGAVRAQQADRAGRESRRHVLQRPVLSVADAEALGLDDRAGEPFSRGRRVRLARLDLRRSGIIQQCSEVYGRNALERSAQAQRVGL